MRNLIVLSALLFSLNAHATGGHNNEGCRGNCEQPTEVKQGQSQSADATAVAGAIAVSGASASADNKNINSVSNRNDVDVGVGVSTSDYNANLNTNVAYGGKGGDGGSAYAKGGEGGSATQGQSQSSNNSNSSNNSAQQSTSITFEAAKEKRFSNNVNAFAPAIYSASACTGGGVSGAASALGVGVSLGGARQIKACQTLENARVLSSLDPKLALIYLCANTNVDIGATLGGLCKPAPENQPAPPVVVDPPVVSPPIEVVTEEVRGK